MSEKEKRNIKGLFIKAIVFTVSYFLILFAVCMIISSIICGIFAVTSPMTISIITLCIGLIVTLCDLVLVYAGKLSLTLIIMVLLVCIYLIIKMVFEHKETDDGEIRVNYKSIVNTVTEGSINMISCIIVKHPSLKI